MRTVEGRVALVTGGSRGVGRAIALKLAAEGADIAINYRRDQRAADETVDAILALGRKALPYRASVDRWDDVVAMVESATADFGSIDILVNNAGIASRGLSVVETDPVEFERVLRTNAFGAHYVSKLVVPGMRERARGDIVMISSDATSHHDALGAPYNMAKAALESLALTLAKEEQGRGIRVNIVAPGLVTTEMGDRLSQARMGVGHIGELDSVFPFGRVCRPEDVANTVAFLVSDAGSYVSGQRIEVNGGGQRRPS